MVKRKLGRGLGSLLENALDETGKVIELDISKIHPNPWQPRRQFDFKSLEDLAASIKEKGLIQPITVRYRDKDGDFEYELVTGERRLRAADLAGLKTVPAIVSAYDDRSMAEVALIENLQREDLDPVEEALGCKRLMEQCSLTQEQAAKKLGKSRSALANTLRLLALPDPVLEDLKIGAITPGHAKVILGLPTQELMEQAASEIISGDLNVRQAEALCKKLAKGPAPEKPVPLREALPVEVESSLREVIGNEVKVDYKRGGKGTLTLHFYSDSQLMAFANLLGGYQKENT